MKLAMVHVQVIGLKEQVMTAVQTIHRLGCVQVENLNQLPDVAVRPFAPDPQTIQAREEIAYLVAQIEGLLATLPDIDFAVDGAAAAAVAAATDEQAAAQAGVAELGPIVAGCVARREARQAELASLPRYVSILRQLLPIVPAAAHRPDHVMVGVLVDRAHGWVLKELADAVLTETEGQAETAVDNLDAHTRAMLIVVPQAFRRQVEAALGREDISQLRLPEDIAHRPPEVAIAALNRRLQAIPHELAQIDAELADLARTWRPRLAGWQVSLRDRLAEIDVLTSFGETDHTFVLAGWLPARDAPALEQALRTAVGDPLVVQIDPPAPTDAERVPVALVNPAPARPFQSLVRMLSLPTYNGIDPTILMAIFLPLFFGMILGDVGYGLVVLLLCLAGLRRFRQPGALHDLLQVVLFGSLWAIFFGLLYGELFGALGETVGLHPLWFDRAAPENTIGLLLFVIGVGAAHVTLGLIIGVYDAVRTRHRHHLLERGGMLIGLMGLFLLIAVLADQLPDALLTPGVVILLVGIVVLSSSLGWMGILLGPIEFIGLLGNILSYLRLAAVGLASVYVANLANQLAGALGVLVVGLIVALLLHSLNVVLGAFSPTIHSLRLHYVEFFRKFYEGGGRPYTPFASTGRQQP